MNNPRRSLAIALFTLTIASPSAFARQPDPPVSLPFVGCAEDGMTGPVAPPTPNGHTPAMPPAVAKQLAYYASEALAVIAPRGWHCVGTYGSRGSSLLVTPEPHDTDDFSRSDFKVKGPVVLVTRFVGGTSGRFDVARIAAPLFPIARKFVKSVIDEGMEPASYFKTKQSSRDTVIHHGPTTVEFQTPANSRGLGTGPWIASTSQPVKGAIILLPSAEMDLIKLQVRLSTKQQALAPHIAKYTLQSTTASWPPIGIEPK